MCLEAAQAAVAWNVLSNSRKTSRTRLPERPQTVSAANPCPQALPSA